LGFIPLILTALLVSLTHCRRNSVAPQYTDNLQYDKFKLGKIELVEYDRDDLVIKITADSIIRRKRKSKLFEYQNLKELCVKNIILNVYLNKRNLPLNNSGFPFTILNKCMMSLSGTNTLKSMESYLQETTDIDLDILSRMLFEGVSLNINYPSGGLLAISAESATIGGDFRNLIMSGDVVITSRHGDTIRAPQAVLSHKFNGILFPSGHLRQKTYHKRQTFYRFASDGKIVKSHKTPKIRYTDLVEESEEKFYNKIFERVPAYVRFMFGMTEKN
jgi:hypothetical protein